MKLIVEINLDECCGHGRCEEAAPEVFAVNDDGLAYLLIDEPGEEHRAEVENAVRTCPAHAISIRP